MTSANRISRAAALTMSALAIATTSPAVARTIGATPSAPASTSQAANSRCSEGCFGAISPIVAAHDENGGYAAPNTTASTTAAHGTQSGTRGGSDWAYIAIGGGLIGLTALGATAVTATRRHDSRRTTRRSNPAA